MLSDIYKYMFQNRIGCVKVSVPASCVVWVRATIGSNQRLQKVSVPASCVVDCGFEQRSGQTKDYKRLAFPPRVW